MWLFPSRQTGKPLDVSSVQRACQKSAARARLQVGVSPHTLRHTFATELLEAGIDLPSIQKILGHTSLSTTAIYLHVRRTHLQAASRAVDLLPLDQLHAPADVQRERPSRPR